MLTNGGSVVDPHHTWRPVIPENITPVHILTSHYALVHKDSSRMPYTLFLFGVVRNNTADAAPMRLCCAHSLLCDTVNMLHANYHCL